MVGSGIQSQTNIGLKAHKERYTPKFEKFETGQLIYTRVFKTNRDMNPELSYTDEAAKPRWNLEPLSAVERQRKGLITDENRRTINEMRRTEAALRYSCAGQRQRSGIVAQRINERSYDYS